MKFIKTIGVDAGFPYETRERVEGVVYNAEGKIALIKVGKYHYHVLPGGMIESHETPYEAIIREVREETGVQIKDIVELGVIIEYMNERKLKRVTYCFSSSADQLLGPPTFTQEEIDEEYELQWVYPDKALQMIENDLANYPKIMQLTKKESPVPHRELEIMRAIFNF